MNQIRIQNNQLEVFTDNRETAVLLMDSLSAFEEGYEHSTRYRNNSWDGKKKFYKITAMKEGWYFTIPKGFRKRVERIIGVGVKGIESKPSEEMLDFIREILPTLPFKPYRHQMAMVIGMMSDTTHLSIAATGAGKSLVAYILSRYYYSRGMKMLIVVPTIDLTIQLYNDFKSYNAPEWFMDEIQQMGGEYNSKEVIHPVLISTYQSCVKADLSNFDVCLTDECHLARSETLLKILSNPFTVKNGMTGTLPMEELNVLKLEQNFGEPKKYITARQLIDLGLATDVSIVPIFLHQSQKLMKYHDEVTFIKESLKRRKFITKFVKKLQGMSVLLYNHTLHGKATYEDLTGVTLDKDLMKSFVRQRDLGVFFLSGNTHNATRKKILEYMSTLSDENVVIIGQQKLLSTGINIKALKNLVFLSSTKSQITVIQSIGRVLRLHDSKSRAMVYDIVDDLSEHRKTENHSLRHFWMRLSYYEMQDLNVIEKEVWL